jgi:hypothetical protein
MKARQLIGGARFLPDELTVVFEAFDDAWADVAPSITNEPDAVEAGRLSLAEIVLSLATSNPIERDALKDAAVKGFRHIHGCRDAQ